MVTGQVISSGMQNRAPQPNSQQIPLGQVIQRIIHPGGSVEEKVVQATPVSGHPGQIVVQTPGGGQQIVQTSAAGGQQQFIQTSGGQQQVIQTSGGQQQIIQQTNNQQVGVQQQPQGGQVMLQPQSAGQVVVSSGGQVITSSGGQTQVHVRTGGQQQQVQKPVIISNDELVENGMSPLDGILPKDPKFGVLDGDMVSELLETSKSENNIVMNGVHLDTSKMNGDVTTGKRLLGEYVDNSPAKKQAVDGGQVIVTNGGHGNGSLNGAGLRQAGGQIANQIPAGGQLVKNTQGQLFIKTSSPSGGVVLQPAGADNNGGNKIVFLQQSDGHQQLVRQQQTV